MKHWRLWAVIFFSLMVIVVFQNCATAFHIERQPNGSPTSNPHSEADAISAPEDMVPAN